MGAGRSPVTSHVLDTTKGVPAKGIPLRLDYAERGVEEKAGDAGVASWKWNRISSGATDEDGRCGTLLPAGHRLEPGVYRVTFETATYSFGITESGKTVGCFYPYVEVVFQVTEEEVKEKGASLHYHIPLLLSPFGYSTYRGS